MWLTYCANLRYPFRWFKRDLESNDNAMSKLQLPVVILELDFDFGGNYYKDDKSRT